MSGAAAAPSAEAGSGAWTPGCAPVAVIMLTLNEGHNIDAALANLAGWAQEVLVVDSFSSDDTVSIALQHGARVVQRRFRGFGDQWNFALRELPVAAAWTMKLDPDERLTDRLKAAITARIEAGGADGLALRRRLHFLGQPLPVTSTVIRVWRTGRSRFTASAVNEHPLVDGTVVEVAGEMAHLDSPDLDHWLAKQNRYTTAEAVELHRRAYGVAPRLLGSAPQRRIWLKAHYGKLPGRYLLTFLYHYVALGAWRAGRVGYVWAHLRTTVYRLLHYKLLELRRGGTSRRVDAGPGRPDPRVTQYD